MTIGISPNDYTGSLSKKSGAKALHVEYYLLGYNAV
jgi:hypothetical protein